MSCPKAKPKKDAVRELWASEVVVLKVSTTWGKAGKYTSVHIGAKAQSIPKEKTKKIEVFLNMTGYKMTKVACATFCKLKIKLITY